MDKSKDSQTGLTKDDIGVLESEFPKERLKFKPQSFSKDKTSVMLIAYLQHTEVQARLNQVDPNWTAGVIAERELPPYKPEYPKRIFLNLSLTLKGTRRENYGEGEDYKSAYSDAFKRAAMMFGVGRYLYDFEQVWAPYNESRDRFKKWTYLDYASALSYKKSREDNVPAGASHASQATQVPQASHTNGGLTCKLCSSALRLSKAGNSYYCPNFKDKSKGEHTNVRVDQAATAIQEEIPLPEMPGLFDAFPGGAMMGHDVGF